MSMAFGCVGLVAVLVAFVELLVRREATRWFYVAGGVGYVLCQVGYVLAVAGK